MPQNPTLEEWRLLTLRLRIAGWSYREIVTRVGWFPTQVFRDIGRVCDRLRKGPVRGRAAAGGTARSQAAGDHHAFRRSPEPETCDPTRATGGDILPGSVRCCPPTPDTRPCRRLGPLGGGSGDGHPRPPRGHGRGGPRRPRPAALRFRCASTHRPQGDVLARFQLGKRR